MCDASDFSVGAVLRQQVYRKFKPIYYANKTLNNAQEHYTTIEKELLALVFAFDKFWFKIEIKDKKDVENLAADHLSRLENPHMELLAEKEIADEFPDEHLMMLKAKVNDGEPWYADYVNYIIGKVVPLKWTPERRKRFYSQVKNFFWDEPYAFRLCPDNVMRRCVDGSKIFDILAHCHSGPTGGHHSAFVTGRKVYKSGFFWPNIFKDAKDYVIRFGVPKALISDRETHFCNSQLEKALQKYCVTHKLSTAYHPQSNEQTEVTNRAIKRIFERSVGYNPKDWSENLNDALWAFRTAYKILTGCTLFRLVYGKASATKNRLMELNELGELRDKAYENTRIYKERTKRWHDSRLRGDKDFKVGDKILLFNSLLRLHLERIERFLNNFINQPNETNMNDLEFDDALVDTPLVSPFPHSDNDSDDGEVD
ncbi:reverse transcriptase domain-containing protein [Tanacetum coccineum]